MENNVIYTDEFANDVKKFLKKFPTLTDELLDFEDKLKENPTMGVPLGAGLYKVRLASKSKSKGKSGGFRIINYLITKNKESINVYVLKIYDKSEESNVRKETLKKLLKSVGLE